MKQQTKDLIQKLVRKGSYNQSDASILAKCELIQIALTNPEILASEGLVKQEYTNQFKQPPPSTEGENSKLRELIEWVEKEIKYFKSSEDSADRSVAFYLQSCVLTKSKELLNR